MPNSVALEAVKTCMEEAKDGVFDLKTHGGCDLLLAACDIFANLV